MASDRFGLFRPIEITASENTFTIGGSTKTIDSGGYGSLLQLLWEIDDQSGATYTWSLDATDNYKVKVSGSAGNFAVVWDDHNLRDILGFSEDDLSGADSYTADDYPQYTFVPTYPRSDQGGLAIHHGKTSRGVNGADGNLTSIAATPIRREMTIDIPFEHAVRVLDEHGATAYDINSNWETFIHGARTAQPSTAANPAMNGFYFYPDVDDAALIQAPDSGGVQFGLSAGADAYVWCAMLAGSTPRPTVAVDSSRLYYNMALRVMTAVAPTWVTLS